MRVLKEANDPVIADSKYEINPTYTPKFPSQANTL